MRRTPRSLKWLLIAVVVGGVAIPSAVAAWPRSPGCSPGSRLVHLGEEGQVESAWTLCVPRGLRVATFQVPHHCMSSTGAWISNFTFKDAQRKRPPSTFPADGIAVRFALDSDVNGAGPDSDLPEQLADFDSAPVGPKSRAAARLKATVIRDEHLYRVSIWLGGDIRPADRRTIEAMVSSLRFTPGKPVEAGAFGPVSLPLP